MEQKDPGDSISRNRTYRYLLFAILLFILFYLPDIIFYGDLSEWKELIWGLLFVGALCTFPVYFFRKRLRWYAYLIGFLCLLAPVALFTVIYFKVRINQDMLTLMYNTNANEAWELMKGYLFIIVPVYIIYIALTLLSVRMLPKCLSKKLSFRASLVALTLIIMVPVLRSGSLNYKTAIRNTISYYYPMYLGLAIHQYDIKEAYINRHPEFVKNFHFNAHRKDSIAGRRVYVYVIGESSRYDHWGINGYSRLTSPLLSHENNLLSYKKVCAAGGLTDLAVPIVITGVDPMRYKDHVKRKSIVSLFKEAGFTTYWITDQTDYGNITMHAKEADTLVLLQSFYLASHMIHHDMELVDTMKAFLSRSNKDAFVVIHTLGSHFNYTYRYPKSFDKFQPSAWHENIRPTDYDLKQQLINGYDNSILYTDAVLDSIIHVLKHLKNAVTYMLYASDHGENLYDYGKNTPLHTINAPTKYIAHIPLFIYLGPRYDSIYPEKVLDLDSHLNYPIESNDIFYTLADMANLSFHRQNATKSFAGKDFVKRRSLIRGGDEHMYYFDQLK